MDLVIYYRIVCFALILWLSVTICYNYYPYLLSLLILKVAFLFLEKRNRELLPINKKSVLITGCDTGFGHHLASKLTDDGFNVFATVWKADSPGAEKLRNRKVPNLHVLQLDVTSADEIAKAVTFINNKTKDKGLWGVVNNAGFNTRGDVELCTLEQYKAVANVNLYGMIAVIKAFLPQIRKSKGRIVNVSSVMGRYAMPRNSSYNSSKHGVETMSDCLRLEMAKFDVSVSIVEPGWYDAATSCSSQEMAKVVKVNCDVMWSAASEEVKAVYGKDYFYLPYEHTRKYGEVGSASSPKPVLDAIEDALINVNPRPRYLVDGSNSFIDRYAMLARVFSFLPSYITDFYLKWLTRCHKAPRDQIIQ